MKNLVVQSMGIAFKPRLLIAFLMVLISAAMGADLTGQPLAWARQIASDLSATQFECAKELRTDKTKGYYCASFDDEFQYFKTQWDAFTSTRAEIQKLDFKALTPWIQKNKIFYRTYRFNFRDKFEVRFQKPFFIIVYTRNAFK